MSDEPDPNESIEVTTNLARLLELSGLARLVEWQVITRRAPRWCLAVHEAILSPGTTTRALAAGAASEETRSALLAIIAAVGSSNWADRPIQAYLASVEPLEKDPR